MAKPDGPRSSPRRLVVALRAGVVAGLLILLVGAPLLFRGKFLAITDGVLAASDARPVPAAALIVAALTLDTFLPVPNGVTSTLAGAAFGFWSGALLIWFA